MNITLSIPRDDFGVKAQPDIRPIKESGQIYRSYEPFTIKVNGREIMVPAGFITDGASSPRLAWTLTGFARDGMHRAAAHIHDWLYENKGILPYGQMNYDRKFADDVFHEMLKAYGIKSWHAWLAYKAVRIAGAAYWRD